MAKDNKPGKQVRDIKSPEPKKPTVEINPGNVPILTVKLLDQIVQEIKGLRADIKELGKDGGSE